MAVPLEQLAPLDRLGQPGPLVAGVPLVPLARLAPLEPRGLARLDQLVVVVLRVPQGPVSQDRRDLREQPEPQVLRGLDQLDLARLDRLDRLGLPVLALLVRLAVAPEVALALSPFKHSSPLVHSPTRPTPSSSTPLWNAKARVVVVAVRHLPPHSTPVEVEVAVAVIPGRRSPRQLLGPPRLWLLVQRDLVVVLPVL